ncbi:MAG: rhodanese-like domain-containing protein [Anaerolineales bacterium]|jgi:thiosulfate/3-mercaptopyruvate sulfurtransferase
MNICKTKLAGMLTALIVMACLPGFALAQNNALVSTDWLSQNLNKPDIVILDVGAFFHYEQKHIPGAIKAFGPWQAVNDKYEPAMMPAADDLVRMIRSYGVNNDSFVVIYDEGVTADDTAVSARALWTLEALGHDKVAILNGGFAAWEHQEKPVSTKTTVPTEIGNFSGKLQAGKLATLDEIKNSKAILLDTRVPQEHFGHEKANYVKRFGHLAHSKLWPISTMTNAGENFSPSFLLSTDELQQMASGVGIPADKNAEIIAYSNRGLSAALAYYVLHDLLGYNNVKLFDGSMVVAAEDMSIPIDRYSWGFATK